MKDAPIKLKLQALQVSAWFAEGGVAGLVPVETVTLVPYSAANPRITASPVAAKR
jgi:hypothetical protein